MSIWFLCRKRTPPPPPASPRRKRNEPTWMTLPTDIYPTSDPGRPGRMTPAQEWRANRGQW